MKKWFKRLLLFTVCVIVMLLVIAGGSYFMLRREPEWFSRPPMTTEVREAAVARAETQFSRVEDLATSLRAYEARRQKAIREGTTLPSAELPKPLTVRLSEVELNAVFQTFAENRGWDEDLAQYISSPTILLQDKQIVLGGKLKDLNIVTSAYFTTTIDEQGQFRLDLSRVLGGKLPLPDVLLDRYRQTVIKDLVRHLPPLQHSAKIDAKGIPNDATVQASLTKLLLQSIEHQSSEPVFFLPLLTAKGTVPVRLTDVIVTDGHIQMTIAPMSETDRAEMLTRLREPYAPGTK